MNIRTPQLKRHASGQWFVKWDGRNHYLGRDISDARRLYIDQLKLWSDWRARRDLRNSTEIGQLCVDIHRAFLQFKELEGGPDLSKYYAKHLRRFVTIFGSLRADGFRPAHMHKLKEHMLRLKFAPKTINHDLVAVRVLFRWACGIEYIPPVDLGAIRNMPLDPPTDKTLKYTIVKAMVDDSPNDMAAWLAINYLCLMRPSEVVKVVHRQGEWIEEGVYQLAKGKTDRMSKVKRHVLFSAEAREWLGRCPPRWSRLDSYSSAVIGLHGRGPKLLQYSAAAHLARTHHVPRERIDLLLGHVPSRVSQIYNPLAWSDILPTVSLLSLRTEPAPP